MNYTIRVVAIMVAVTVSAYSCSWYHVESEKQNTLKMKTCMDAGHMWKDHWIRGWYYCE